MTKAVRLTVPVVDRAVIKQLTPKPDNMALCEINDTLLYGFYGRTASQGPYLNAAYTLADKNGEISSGKKLFYLVDIEYSAQENLDDKIMCGHLQPEMLVQTPFLIAKRISINCALTLGEMWFEWAKAAYGSKKILSADVDWANEMSFMPAFPSLAENLFMNFPKLRCVVMPMRVKLETPSNLLCWIGVSPKAQAQTWVSRAQIRMKNDIRVNLKFDTKEY